MNRVKNNQQQLVFQHISREFITERHCLEFLFTLRHPAACCPKCLQKGSYYRHPTKPCYTCSCGDHHIYPRVGTVLQGSKIPLTNWFWALAILCDYKGDLTNKVIRRLCKVTQPTAERILKCWRVLWLHSVKQGQPLHFAEIFVAR